MKSLSACLTRAKEPLQLLERELGPPAANEVRLTLEACGLGLADWHVAMLDALPFTPLNVGQEAVGRDASGARYGITPLATSCGTCAECTSGVPALCTLATWHGFSRDGALCVAGNFATQHLMRLPEKGDAAELAVLMGSGLTALAAARAAGPVRSLGVFGLGGVGHLAVQLARAETVVVIEPDASRHALAAGKSVIEPRKEPMLDAALVCVPSTQAMQQAFAMLKPEGQLLVCAESPAGRFDLSLHALVRRGVTVRGITLGTRAQLVELLALYANGAVKPHVTRRSLTDAPAALYTLRDGGFSGRLVFT